MVLQLNDAFNDTWSSTLLFEGWTVVSSFSGGEPLAVRYRRH
jgi:hypothetical protein